MSDYREMYYTLFRASEQAIDLLIKVQRECEELYLSAPETELTVLKTAAAGGRDQETGTSNL